MLRIGKIDQSKDDRPNWRAAEEVAKRSNACWGRGEGNARRERKISCRSSR